MAYAKIGFKSNCSSVRRGDVVALTLVYNVNTTNFFMPGIVLVSTDTNLYKIIPVFDIWSKEEMSITKRFLECQKFSNITKYFCASLYSIMPYDDKVICKNKERLSSFDLKKYI
jgi:hypothetical protein